MAKKGTTGGPRARRVTAEETARRQTYKSKAEREKMWQQRTFIVIAAIVIVSVAALLGAVAYEKVIRPNQAITTVNGSSVKTVDYQDRVRYLRWLTAQQIRDFYYLVGGDANTIQQYAGTQINNLRQPEVFGSQVLDEMEEEKILDQAAKDMGIKVDTAAVDEQVNRYMAQLVGLTAPALNTATPTTVPSLTPTPLVSPTPSNTPQPTNTPTLVPSATPSDTEPTPTPGPSATPTVPPTETPIPSPTATLEPSVVAATLEAQANTFYSDAKKAADVSRSQARQLFYYDALRSAIQDYLIKDLPAEELKVNARHILISFNPDLPAGQAPPPTDEEKAAALEKANAALKALQDGEPFADLAMAISNDTSASNGGELGWASPDNYVANFKDAVLNAAIGDIVGPIESEYGYHIIQVHGREIRPLSDSEITTRKTNTFQTWLDTQKQNAKIDRRNDWIDRVPSDPTYNDLLGDILPVN